MSASLFSAPIKVLPSHIHISIANLMSLFAFCIKNNEKT